ncbi:uncharacterized protein B0H18DRAFT_168289 [Fomitopsis serialis]|uniref:uncharacterized protein n=1 Tax=Fomitopsis serialis TaxID=139415 RepID=UPI0020076DE6|nr:uncharacterized protein B0H18DRAFT_168289 [Neoantrodia serialis]KAH9913493.1 hypothetical protein B0H18DRAFT_168289 [Neoantrodia serialis]
MRPTYQPRTPRLREIQGGAGMSLLSDICVNLPTRPTMAQEISACMSELRDDLTEAVALVPQTLRTPHVSFASPLTADSPLSAHTPTYQQPPHFQQSRPQQPPPPPSPPLPQPTRHGPSAPFPSSISGALAGGIPLAAHVPTSGMHTTPQSIPSGFVPYSYAPTAPYTALSGASSSHTEKNKLKHSDLPKFFGNDGDDVDDWISQISNIVRYTGVEDTVILRCLPLILRGPAFKWFNTLSQPDLANLMNWTDCSACAGGIRVKHFHNTLLTGGNCRMPF